MPTPAPYVPEYDDPTWESLRPRLLLPEHLYRDYGFAHWSGWDRDVQARHPSAAIDRAMTGGSPLRRVYRDASGQIVGDGFGWSWHRHFGTKHWQFRPQLAAAILPREG